MPEVMALMMTCTILPHLQYIFLSTQEHAPAPRCVSGATPWLARHTLSLHRVQCWSRDFSAVWRSGPQGISAGLCVATSNK